MWKLLSTYFKALSFQFSLSGTRLVFSYFGALLQMPREQLWQERVRRSFIEENDSLKPKTHEDREDLRWCCMNASGCKVEVCSINKKMCLQYPYVYIATYFIIGLSLDCYCLYTSWSTILFLLVCRCGTKFVYTGLKILVIFIINPYL